ncbi:hypothetical protein HBB16_17750 [Pseudonocardia sp. MCCB 268]|nr:hypothetical protein [Pseudonocardia cytotoxica]
MKRAEHHQIRTPGMCSGTTRTSAAAAARRPGAAGPAEPSPAYCRQVRPRPSLLPALLTALLNRRVRVGLPRP